MLDVALALSLRRMRIKLLRQQAGLLKARKLRISLPL